ncbi:MAG: hypothetical protein L0G22_01925 [Propionibacteriaceae bacterium]|nr:hypothetical protein [Propionibacteriaceae bacterium]
MTGDQRPEDARPDEFDATEQGWDPGDATVELPVGEPADPDAVVEEPLVAAGPDATALDAPGIDPAVEGSGVAAGGAAVGATAVGGTAAGAPTAVEPARRQRTGLIIGLILLLLALIVGGWLWWDATSRAQRDEAIRSTATTYLNSVAGSDAAGALATLAEQPSNTTLLTDEVLQASAETTPITDITVGTVTSEGETASADVSYRIGEEAVQLTLPMTGDGRTTWHLTDGLGELTTTTTDHLTVNGAELTEATNPVFPGTYTAASSHERLTLNGTTSALVASPQADAAELSPEFALSEAGSQAVLNAVRTRFDECVASTESLPANCPFGVDAGEGVVVEDGSVRFSVNNDPWEGFAPALDPATMTASGTIHMNMGATANVTYNGLVNPESSVNFEVDRAYAVNVIDDPMVVTWS